MKVYTMEDLYIENRIGRAVPTGSYEITRIGTRRATTKFQETFQTNAGKFTPDKWYEIARSCVESSGTGELFARIKEHCGSHCAWLKNDNDIEEYALNILVGRVYRRWKDFSTAGLTENSSFLFEFVDVMVNHEVPGTYIHG